MPPSFRSGSERLAQFAILNALEEVVAGRRLAFVASPVMTPAHAGRYARAIVEEQGLPVDVVVNAEGIDLIRLDTAPEGTAGA